MKTLKNILLFVIFIIFQAIKSEIISVVEINRHGARTPKNFPNVSSKLFFGSKDMTLTINGFRQHQILGELVKKKYMKKNHLLKSTYDSTEFQMVSTPTQRTIFSAAGFLSGVYPDYIVKMKYDGGSEMTVDDTVPNIDNDTQIQEIPIRVISPSHDFLFHAENCKFNGRGIDEYLREVNSQVIFEIEEQEKRRVFKQLHTLCKLDHSPKYHSGVLEDVDHYSEKEFDEMTRYFFPFLYHFHSYLDKKIEKNSMTTIKKFTLNKWFTTRMKDSKYLRLTVSALFRNILDTFDQIKANDNKPHMKYKVFSAHDTILVNIFANLISNPHLADLLQKAVDDEKTFKLLVPPFASNIFFELHKEDDKFFVRILYNGRNINNGLKFIGEHSDTDNSKKIEWSHFEKLMKNLIDDDYKKLDCSEGGKQTIVIQNSIEELKDIKSHIDAKNNIDVSSAPSIGSNTNSFLRN
jgi:hypothetical protein